jgi:hypothetical protein
MFRVSRQPNINGMESLTYIERVGVKLGQGQEFETIQNNYIIFIDN